MAESKAHAEWTKANTCQIKARLNRNTDADILKHLEGVDNIAGYIKSLIRADIEREKNLKKTENPS